MYKWNDEIINLRDKAKSARSAAWRSTFFIVIIVFLMIFLFYASDMFGRYSSGWGYNSQPHYNSGVNEKNSELILQVELEKLKLQKAKLESSSFLESISKSVCSGQLILATVLES